MVANDGRSLLLGGAAEAVAGSDPAPKPQTAGDIVRDPPTALRAAKVPTHVFTGFSNGGLYARFYASRYPAR